MESLITTQSLYFHRASAHPFYRCRKPQPGFNSPRDWRQCIALTDGAMETAEIMRSDLGRDSGGSRVHIYNAHPISKLIGRKRDRCELWAGKFSRGNHFGVICRGDEACKWPPHWLLRYCFVSIAPSRHISGSIRTASLTPWGWWLTVLK